MERWGTTSELPGLQNAKAETSMIGNALAMNTLSLTDYKIDENFFIFDGPNEGEGFGVIGGRLYSKINEDCFVDPGYFYVLSASSTYVTYVAWLAAVANL